MYSCDDRLVGRMSQNASDSVRISKYFIDSVNKTAIMSIKENSNEEIK